MRSSVPNADLRALAPRPKVAMTRIEQRSRGARRALATACWLAVGACAPTRVQSPRTCGGNWSIPFPLEAEGRRPVYIEPGIILPQGDRALVLGAPTLFWMRPDSLVTVPSAPDDSLSLRAVLHGGAIVDARGRATPVPSLDYRFSETPRLLSAKPGEIRVAWIASDSPLVRGRWPSSSRIQISTFRETEWSDSQTLMHGKRVRIGQPPAERAPPTDDDAVIAASYLDSNLLRARLLWKKAGTWRQSDWSGADHASTAYATITADGGALMLVMGTTPEVISGVFAVRASWNERGISWSRPVLIDSLRGRYSDLAWAKLGGDSLLVVWYQTSEDTSSRGMITALTTDGGRQWRVLRPHTFRFAMDSPALAIDTFGQLHMVYRAQPHQNVLNEPGVIVHTVWRDGNWSAPEIISQRPSDTAPMLGSAPRDKLMAIWTEAQRDTTQASTSPKSFGSIWTPICR